MTTYKIVIRGVAPGVPPSFAANQLSVLLKATPEIAAAVLASGGHVVKAGVDAATAAKYEAALKARGCVCDIVLEHDESDGLTFDTPVSVGGPAVPNALAGPLEKPPLLPQRPQPREDLAPNDVSDQPRTWKLISAVGLFLAMGIGAKFTPDADWKGTAGSVLCLFMAGAGGGALLFRRVPQRGFAGVAALTCGVLLAGAGVLLPVGVRSGGSAVDQSIAGVERVSVAAAAVPLTEDEKAEIQKIKSAGVLAGQLGHDLAPNLKLQIAPDQFGEHATCLIDVHGQDNAGQMAHSNFDLVVQIGPSQSIVWTRSLGLDSAPEIRLYAVGSREFYALNRRMTGGALGNDLNSKLLAIMLNSKKITANSGLLLGKEVTLDYDMTAFPKAYRYALALCDHT